MSSDRCPHCRLGTGVSPTRRGGLRCKVCGGPRIVLIDPLMTLSGRERPPLVEARKQRTASWAWAGAALFLTLIGLGLLLITSTILLIEHSFLTELSTWAHLFFLAVSATPLGGALLAWHQSRRAGRRADSALDSAELSAVGDLLAGSRSALTAEEVSRLLMLPEASAERLLAKMNVDDHVMSHVTATGNIAYRIAPPQARFTAQDLDDEFEENPDEKVHSPRPGTSGRGPSRSSQ